MPRATNIRGVPIAVAVPQRQAIFAAQVQAASVPAQVEAAVDDIAVEIGADLSAIESVLADVDATLATVDATLIDHNNRLEALEP